MFWFTTRGLQRLFHTWICPRLASKNDAPAPVDNIGAAKMQGQQSRQTALFNTQLARANQITPTGSLKWNWTPELDAKGNIDYSKPGKWSSEATLSPQEQKIFDAGESAKVNLSSGAAEAATRARQSLSNPFNIHAAAGDQIGTQTGLQNGDYSQVGPNFSNVDASQLIHSPESFLGDKAAVTQALYNKATQFYDPRYSRDEEALRSRLSNQGLDENSAAYKNQIDEFNRNKNDAYAGAVNNAIIGGTQAQTADVQNLLASLTGAQGIQNQQFNEGQQYNTNQFQQALGQFNTGTTAYNEANQARSQRLAEALQQRNMPLQDYQSFMSGAPNNSIALSGNPGIGANSAGVADTGNFQAAAQADYNQNKDAANVSNSNNANMMSTLARGAGGAFLGSGLGAGLGLGAGVAGGGFGGAALLALASMM